MNLEKKCDLRIPRGSLPFFRNSMVKIALSMVQNTKNEFSSEYYIAMNNSGLAIFQMTNRLHGCLSMSIIDDYTLKINCLFTCFHDFY